MKRFLTWCAVGSILLGLAACGGASPEPQVPAAPPAGSDADSQQRSRSAGGALIADDAEATAGLDLSAVPAPAEVVASLRWQQPNQTLADLASYAKMPQSFVDAQVRTALYEAVREELDDMVDAKPFADLIALDAPIDVIVAVDTKQTQPQPMFAIAVGLSSLRGALGAVKGRPEPLGPGMWKLGADNSYGPRCVVAASAGTAPARLICAERYRHLEVLAPYVARTLPSTVQLPVDGRLELRMKGLAKRYGPMLHSRARGLPVLAEEFKLDIPAFDDALMDAATALAEEAGDLIYDLDTIRIDADIDPQRGAKLTGKFQFAGKRSWIVSAAMDGTSLAGPAPDIFWRLPKPSDTVNWTRTSDPARYAKILSTLRKLLDGGLQKIRFGTAADRAAVAKLLRLPFGKFTATAGAGGHFDGAPSSTASEGLLGELFGDTLGWQLFGLEEGPTALRAYLQELVRTYNRPTLQQRLRKELGTDAQLLPRVRIVPAPRALGAGGLDVELTVKNIEDPFDTPPLPGKTSQRGTPRTTSFTFHVLLMADGASRTWLGFAADRDRLARIMATTKGPSPGPDSLAQRPGLSQFKRGRYVSGGMITLEAFIEAMKPGMSTAMQLGPGAAEMQQLMAALRGLPHQGKSPMLVLATAVDGPRPSVAFEMTVPRGTLEDTGHLLRSVLALAP